MRRTLLTVSAIALSALGSLPAHGSTSLDETQISYPKNLEGSWYVVSSAQAPMRAGDKGVFYVVATFEKGDFIVAASNTDEYAAAHYPESLAAAVPVGEVDPGSTKGTVVLIEDSRLRAMSSLLGMSGSWKGLYKDPIPRGTPLEVIEELKSNSGQLVGYRVRAPRPPVSTSEPLGYIKMSDLRPATHEEVRGFLGQSTPKESADPEPTEEQAPEPEPAVDLPADPQEHLDSSNMDPMDEPGLEITAPINEPEVVTIEDPIEIDEPVVIESKPIEQPKPILVAPDKSARPIEPVLSVSALETLEATFNTTRRLPRKQLDEALEELLAEYTRAFDAAANDASLARALSQRIEWLKIRMETRDQRHAITSTLTQSDRTRIEAESKIDEWKSGRAYILVGRMVPSAVYTGDQLPLLYRVQGTDDLTGRRITIGYVAPSSDQDFRGMLGSIVGIIGSSELDPALNLRIIRPDRIDAMPE